jgi:hypothetical protein
MNSVSALALTKFCRVRMNAALDPSLLSFPARTRVLQFLAQSRSVEPVDARPRFSKGTGHFVIGENR